MKTYPVKARVLATSLSALAGFVDATGFIHLGGFFVSFMSGNTTRFGVSLAEGSSQAAIAVGLLLTFVGGVVAGSLIGHVAMPHRRPAVLALVALLLMLAAGSGSAGIPLIAAVAMALAMGAENAVFEQDGEVRIGLTYMTGTLVKLGQRLAAAMLGGDRLGWMPYFMLWLGLAGGGVAGAVAYGVLGINTLWIAVAAAAACATAAALMGPDQHEPDLEAV